MSDFINVKLSKTGFMFGLSGAAIVILLVIFYLTNRRAY